MKMLNIFFYEWKHFVRNPFKLVALILFTGASLYGLHHGASLYHEQNQEIAQVEEQINEDRATYLAYYEQGVKGPENRPWVDMTEPFWAIWTSYPHHIKHPSTAMVYSIGQAEQYGFYKRVSFQANTYDPDMIPEIANPERLQTGTLDFTFSILYLLPLLLLILFHNLRSGEAERGFLPLIEVQAPSSNIWLLTRIGFYLTIVSLLLSLLIIYGGLLTGVFSESPQAFGQMLLISLFVLLFWSALYVAILRKGTSIMGNAIKMVGVWLLFAFIIPASIHQWVSLKKPANLMTGYIDALRDDRYDIYDQPDSVLRDMFFEAFPDLNNGADTTGWELIRNESAVALASELIKSRIELIEEDNDEKNQIIRRFYWMNPVSFFQNQYNKVSGTHYDDYKTFRAEIQALIDHQTKVLLLDTWAEKVVGKEDFLAYHTSLQTIPHD